MSWIVTIWQEFDTEADARAAAGKISGDVQVQEHIPYSPEADSVTVEEDEEV